MSPAGPEKKAVRLNIFNQTYSLLVSGDPAEMERAADEVDELMTTGRLRFYDRLLEQIPPSLIAITEIPHIGPKSAMLLFQNLGIQGMAQHEYVGGVIFDQNDSGRLRLAHAGPPGSRAFNSLPISIRWTRSAGFLK